MSGLRMSGGLNVAGAKGKAAPKAKKAKGGDDGGGVQSRWRASLIGCTDDFLGRPKLPPRPAAGGEQKVRAWFRAVPPVTRSQEEVVAEEPVADPSSEIMQARPTTPAGTSHRDSTCRSTRTSRARATRSTRRTTAVRSSTSCSTRCAAAPDSAAGAANAQGALSSSAGGSEDRAQPVLQDAAAAERQHLRALHQVGAHGRVVFASPSRHDVVLRRQAQRVGCALP